VGLLSLVTLANILFLHSQNLADVFPADQLTLAQQQLAAYWSQPWYMPFLGTFERVFVLVVHITASIIVLQAFTRGKIYWVWLAVAWHAAMDGILAVYLPVLWRNYPWWPFAIEGLMGVFAAVSLVILFALKQPEPAQDEPPDLPEPIQLSAWVQPEENCESLELTKYNK
jgi:uncharacterized membrane protein YhfC